MKSSTVYFHPITSNNPQEVAKVARKVLERMVEDEKIKLERELPIKVHVGEPGNVSFVKPANYDGVITYLQSKKVNPYFVETVTVTGERNTAEKHKKVAKDHGFTQIPFVIADGEKGDDQVEVPVVNGKYFKTAKIAKGLADKPQVLVVSHFKGHCDSGFGGAIKMLGIGFASRIGKMEQHSKHFTPAQKTINWMMYHRQHHGSEFRFRTAEYAQAATADKKYLYLTFAMDLVSDCDCDGRVFKPVYKDLGVFASTDPVAIDKAVFDVLAKREGKKPFAGDEIFPYAESLNLGSQKYEIIQP